ncbi:Fc receptor-like protein 5, partial [Silurus meridionalis]
GRPKAVLSIIPDSHVLIGERVVLKCEVQGRRGAQWIYSWYKNNNRLSEEEDGDYTFRPIMGLLIIQFVSESDSGDYTCRGQRRDSWRSKISDAVTLTVLGRPKPVASIIPDKQVFSGDTVTLRCEIQDESVSRWQYSWYKDASLSPVSSVQMYTISSVEVTHTGKYTCKGRESGGSRSSHLSDAVTLTVSERPKPVASINPDKQVFSGDTVTLRCEIQDESVSRWQYSWYKDASLSPVSSVQMYTISSVEVTHTGKYTCKGRESGGSRSSHLSDAVTLTVSERLQAVLSVSPQNWLIEGDSVTLSCEVTDSSTDWTFSWYTVVPFRDGVTAIKNNRGFIMYVELLSDSSRGSGGFYTLSPSALHHTGVYVCRGERGEPAFHTQYSNPQSLWITGESPPVSLIISPSRTQHFIGGSLSLSCEDQSNSTGWTVRRYTDSEGVLDCSQWGSVTGSTCIISFLYTSYTGVYWCESESGENSNPVNITVHGESPPVSLIISPSRTQYFTRDPLSLSCEDQSISTGWTVRRYTDSEGVLDCSQWGSVTGSTCHISFLSTSYTGVYWCESESGENSNPVNITVHVLDSRPSAETVGLAVGLSLFLLFIVLLILMILLWFYKMKKEKQLESSQTSEQNQRRSGAEDSQSGYTPLQTGADAELGMNDVTYAEVQLKPIQKVQSAQEKTSVGDDTVYSELHHSMKVNLIAFIKD